MLTHILLARTATHSERALVEVSIMPFLEYRTASVFRPPDRVMSKQIRCTTHRVWYGIEQQQSPRLVTAGQGLATHQLNFREKRR